MEALHFETLGQHEYIEGTFFKFVAKLRNKSNVAPINRMAKVPGGNFKPYLTCWRRSSW